MQENINIPDSNVTANLTFRQLVLMNMQQLTNFPYIEKDFDALTDYELLSLVVKFLNDVIANQNDQNDSITSMYNAFLDLQTYVNNTKDTLETAFNNLDDYVRNFFDNLDLQEEVNNKLDEMLEDGVLEQIIEQFLQLTSLLCFNNVSEMKSSINLTNGSFAKTLGYYSINDGGESTYKIRTKTNEDVTNEQNLVAIGDNLVAELIIEETTINPIQFGCYGDGIHDDTDNLQDCIDYAISNKKQIDFIGDYKVTPSLQEDGTKVCLKLFRDSTGGVHGTDTGISLNFIRESKIFTESTDDCTLIRMNIANVNFENAFLKGIQNKTTLLELSKIDKLSTTESQWTCYNIFRNLMLLDSKEAIRMEGQTYYNTFDKCTIRRCTDGIILDMTTLEKLGTQNDSGVNRNDFSNITIQNSTGTCIKINYGDTNKFTNISFEGYVNGLYLDDPKKHPEDFLITPLYYTDQNMFINLIAEAGTGDRIYNNSDGLKIINTSIPYQHAHNNFQVKPMLYLGGANDYLSIEKIMDIYKSLEDLPIPNTQKYTTIIDSNNGTISRFYSDFQKDNNVYKVLSRRNIPFDEENIVNLKSGTNLIYESSYKCVTKQIGGIVFLSSKFTMQPDNLNSYIELPLDSSITANNQLYQHLNIPPITVPVYVWINSVPTIVECRIMSNKLRLVQPSSGWSSSIIVNLNINWFRDTLAF